jgi:hypothetical protein
MKYFSNLLFLAVFCPKTRLTAPANLPIVIPTIPAKPRVGSLASNTAQIGGLLFSGLGK